MIRYELKKIWGRRIFLLAFVIFVILDSAKIMYDSYKYHPKNIFNIRRSELYDMVEGEWNSETIDYVVSTYKNASKIVSSGNYSTVACSVKCLIKWIICIIIIQKWKVL